MSRGRRLRVRRIGLGILGPLVALACTAPISHPTPVARDGVLDLTSWRPGVDGTARLDGRWAYWPGVLLGPDDPRLDREPPGFARVPGTWGEEAAVAGEPEGHGCATYALTVRLPAGPAPLGLRLLTASSAYRLFAQGRRVAEAGVVAETRDAGRPDYRPTVVPLPPAANGTLRFVLQVSNFDYARGGPWEPIWIGAFHDVRRAREGRVAVAVFLAGAFLIFGLYHLIVWIGRRRDRSTLYFALLGLTVAVRGLTVDEIYLREILPALPWIAAVRLEYVSLIGLLVTTVPFLRALYPEELPVGVARGFIAPGLLAILLVVVLPPETYSRGLGALQVLLVAGAIGGPVVVTQAVRRRREGAWLFLAGALAIAIGGVHDALLSVYRVLPTGSLLGETIYLLPFGLLVFGLSQSILLARRSVRAMNEVESTSERLRAAHEALDEHARELEGRVAERTNELEEANRRLSRLAELDGLTRLANRRSFDESLRAAWSDHARRNEPLSLLVVDVDRFKAYNDGYGHLAGDEALRRIAMALQRTARRPNDVVARYGGEEMVVLLPNTGAEGAGEVGEQARRRVETLAIAHESSDVEPVVTVSIGVASIVPRAELDRETLVARADEALYEAKRAGRNRVVVV